MTMPRQAVTTLRRRCHVRARVQPTRASAGRLTVYRVRDVLMSFATETSLRTAAITEFSHTAKDTIGQARHIITKWGAILVTRGKELVTIWLR
jgi:hypothetical protein